MSLLKIANTGIRRAFDGPAPGIVEPLEKLRNRAMVVRTAAGAALNGHAEFAPAAMPRTVEELLPRAATGAAINDARSGLRSVLGRAGQRDTSARMHASIRTIEDLAATAARESNPSHALQLMRRHADELVAQIDATLPGVDAAVIRSNIGTTSVIAGLAGFAGVAAVQKLTPSTRNSDPGDTLATLIAGAGLGAAGVGAATAGGTAKTIFAGFALAAGAGVGQHLLD